MLVMLFTKLWDLLGEWLAAFLMMSLVLMIGCSGLGGKPKIDPIQQNVKEAWTTVVAPVLQTATKDLKTATAHLQAGGQLINPGYVVEGEGMWCTGIKFKGKIFVDGVSAQLGGSAQWAEERAPPTMNTNTEEEPVSTSTTD